VAGITGTSSIGDIQKKLIAPVRFTLQQGQVMQNTVQRIVGSQGQDDTLNIPKFSTATAYGLTEGIPIAQAQQITDSNTAISATEVGVEVIVSDKLRRTLNINMLRSAGRIMGEAMSKKKDSDLLGLFDGLDTSLGSAGTTIAFGYIETAVARIMAASEPGPKPFFTVLHAYQWKILADDLQALSSSAFVGTTPMESVSEQVLKQFTLPGGELYGTRFLIDNNLSIDSSDDAKGATYARDAFVLFDWMPLGDETERDAGLRADRLIMISDYGYGEYNGTWGYEQYFDASTPTS
jgi:hypothetical protein